MRKALVNSLPKSGTNLLAKCLQLFGYRERGHVSAGLTRHRLYPVRRLFWRAGQPTYTVGVDMPVPYPRAPIDRMLRRLRAGQFMTAHVGYEPDLWQAARHHGVQPLVITRDPRAVLVSFVHFVARWDGHPMHAAFRAWDEEARFRAALTGGTFGAVTLQPLRVRCEAMMPWTETDGVLGIRFEELIGAEGGGSAARQTAVLGALCDWLALDAALIPSVQAALFGPGRHTFRKGQIRAWEDEIPVALRPRIDEELGEILTRWGYDRLYEGLQP